MAEAPETLEGWYAFHDVRTVDWAAWRRLAADERGRAIAEARRLLDRFEAVADSPEGASRTYKLLGHKGDLLLFHLRPTLEGLHALELAFDKTLLATVTTQTYSYLSVVELSRHAAGRGGPGGAGGAGGDGGSPPEDDPYIQSRLKPAIPARSHICFYPMDKKRGERENWYTLSPAERGELMRSHGMIGRRYTDRVTQIITGSMGLDDWEWGVTLFADDPLVFKKLVYEMRFDEVSAKYGLFGPFYVGIRLEPEGLAAYLHVDPGPSGPDRLEPRRA